jgi:hypothetical protein
MIAVVIAFVGSIVNGLALRFPSDSRCFCRYAVSGDTNVSNRKLKMETNTLLYRL